MSPLPDGSAGSGKLFVRSQSITWIVSAVASQTTNSLGTRGDLRKKNEKTSQSVNANIRTLVIDSKAIVGTHIAE